MPQLEVQSRHGNEELKEAIQMPPNVSDTIKDPMEMEEVKTQEKERAGDSTAAKKALQKLLEKAIEETEEMKVQY